MNMHDKPVLAHVCPHCCLVSELKGLKKTDYGAKICPHCNKPEWYDPQKPKNIQSISEIIEKECCGNLLDSIDHPELVKRVRELELRVIDQQEELDEFYARQGNKEAFARQVYMAGVEYGTDNGVKGSHKAWLKYKVEKLL